MTRALLRLAAMAACAVALSGCISLLPKNKPAQLYRFGFINSGQLHPSVFSLFLLFDNRIAPTPTSKWAISRPISRQLPRET